MLSTLFASFVMRSIISCEFRLEDKVELMLEPVLDAIPEKGHEPVPPPVELRVL